MERFVRLIVVGGVVLVAGLWIAAFAEPRSGPWIAGLALVLGGISELAVGIASEIQY